MALAQLVYGDLQITGNLAAGSMTVPAAAVANAQIAAAAGIEVTKLEHRHALHHSDLSTGAAASGDRFLGAVYGTTGDLVSFKAGVYTAMSTATDGTLSVTIDLKKGTAAGALATVLTAPIVLTRTQNTAARTLYSATINATTLAQLDQLWLSMTVTGTAATAAAGLFAHALMNEDAV